MTENAADERPPVEADVARPASSSTAAQKPTRLATYRRRFTMLYVALALAAGVGVGALIVLLARPDAGPEPAWSVWQPSGSSNARVKQIADHVAARYRFASGDQIVVALGGPPAVTAGGGGEGDIPIRAIAVRPDTSTGKAEEGDIDIVEADGSMQFVLCGLGESCSIAQGEPSEARHALLRREALELALYTFKYVDGVNSVTVFLPPRPDAQAPGTAVFLERGDVRPELSKPLTRTLAPGAPQIGSIPAKELQTLERITRSRLYQYDYTQAQDGSAVLVLDPVVLGA